jgi:tRNA U34 5-methylaminomethyl-2-thiouridine-forming methyltransferase MnmC
MTSTNQIRKTIEDQKMEAVEKGNPSEEENDITKKQSQSLALPNNSYTPSVAGSVLEAIDGFGGTVLIRIQNIASTANLGVRLGQFHFLFFSTFYYP